MSHAAIKDTSDSQHLKLDKNERRDLADLVTKVFDAWDLAPNERAMLLGLSPSGHSTIRRYASGQPIGQNRDLIWRIGNILAIYEILHASDVDMPARADRWPTSPNRKLDGVRPIEIMYKPDGLAAIRAWLNASVSC